MSKKKIAVLLADDFEDSELTGPVERLRQAGHEVEILGVEEGAELSGKQGEASVTTHAKVSDRDPRDYDAVLIPGGYAPDKLRTEPAMVDFVKRAFASDKTIAAICHAPQLLIEADLVRGKRMTSWPSVRTDLRNAGASWVDEEVVVDPPFITSRKPDDIEAFSNALIARLG